MFCGWWLLSSSSAEIEDNDQDDHQMQRARELTKFVNFDDEIWLNIFHHLSDLNLAKVAAVCKRFETLAQKVFKQRHKVNGECGVVVPIDLIGWKVVLCRFRNIIVEVHLTGQTCPHGKDALRFIDEFLSESVKRLKLLLDPKALKNWKFRKTFSKLERLFILGMNDERNFATRLSQWCPNLKHLTIVLGYITNEDFFRQSLPLLEVVQFGKVHGMTRQYLWMFFAKNNQLKEVSLEGTEMEEAMSWLQLVNELLINVEKVTITTHTFDNFPLLRRNFDNLKSLSFLMGRCRNDYGTYTNELLQITKYLPNIEILRVVNCLQNSMTNADLVELIDRSSATLKELYISCRNTKRALTFGYDLHRQIYGMENRSDICIEFEFGDTFDRKEFNTFIITKEGIWEDHKLIALAPRLPNF